MSVFDLETLRILDVNQAAVRHYGWARDELVEMTIRELLPVRLKAGGGRPPPVAPATRFRVRGPLSGRRRPAGARTVAVVAPGYYTLSAGWASVRPS